MRRRALLGAAIFDGARLREGAALLLDRGTVAGVVDPADIPDGYAVTRLSGGVLCPGFVDLQVNGGGGVMVNDAPSVETLRTIAAAHASLGTRAFLPTLITDAPARARAAVEAAVAAVAEGVPGVAGLHLEGPHLSVARKGAHDPALIRPMAEADCDFLCEAAARLPTLMVTVAPESVSPAQIARLAAAGAVVSLGHSDCGCDDAMAAFAAGATCATHLFNAMSPLASRAPGLVGAALDARAVACGLIADGAHVHPAAIRIALAAKGPGRVFLVTDAMAVAGTDLDGFALNGRRVSRGGGRLTLADGTLAGADLDMATAIRVMVREVGVALADALAMATSVPAGLLRDAGGAGRLSVGAPWRGVYLDAELRLAAA